MLTDKILSFFSGVDMLQTQQEIESIKEFNPQTDTNSDINRKKTAQTGQQMSNAFSKDIQYVGKILQIHSINRNKGFMKNSYQLVDSLLADIHTRVGNEVRQKIEQNTIPHLPSLQNYFGQKTIIISDFLWTERQLNECIQACKENKIRCIVVPLLTSIGIMQHTLEKKYPNYFRSL